MQIDGDIEEVGKYAFQGASCLEAFTVNGSVGRIERGAFQGCGKLSNLDLGENIGIYDYAFGDCRALTGVRIPEGAGVSDKAFSGCSNIRTLYFPNSAKTCSYYRGYLSEIPNGSPIFWDCPVEEATMPGRCLARTLFGKENARRNLKTVSIAPGSERILGFGCESYNNSLWIDATVGGDGYSCTNLVSVTIPPSVTNIAMTAFNGCSSLKEVNISDFAAWCKMDIKSNPLCITKRLTLNGQDIRNAVIPESVKRIGFGAFYNCDFFESIEIPETVEEVGPYAFHGCPNLRAIPPTIKNIGEFAFQNCTGLTEVVIPNGTKKLSGCIFDGCSGLESVTLPDGLEVIGGAAFYGCTNLFSIAIPDSVTNIETSAFANCSRLKTIKLPNGQPLRTHVPFSGCNNVETVNIPQSWHEIPQQCFSGMRGLVTMAIPGNIETVGGSSFWYCYALKQVTLGDGIKNIEKQAFSGCTNIVSLVIPCTVTNIGWNAFSNCSSLERIHLPRLFEGNTGDMGLSENCEIVFYDGSTPAMDIATGEVSVPYDWIKSFFPDIANEAATIQNVANAIAANGVNKVWECYVAGISPTDEASKFKARIEMVDGKAVVKWTPDLNEDGAKAVREYRVLGKRTLDAGEDWTDVTNVADLEAAGFRFFRVSVDLIDSFEDRPLWTIEDGVLVGMEFNGTDVDVVIPDGVIAIADEAFAGMNELRSIVIPESVEHIGRRAFAGCEKLLAVKIEGALCDYDIEDLYSGTPSELVTFATGIWDGPTEIWCERTLVIEGGQSLDASDANIVITSEGSIQPALPDDSLEVWVGGIPSLP